MVTSALRNIRTAALAVYKASFRRPKLVLVFCLLCTLISMLDIARHAYKEKTKEYKFLPDRVSAYDFKPLQPDVYEDFPIENSENDLIPHIIHQTYKDTMIPYQFVNFVKSWKLMNPKWTYYFWTDESARRLIADRHPDVLSTWDNYRTGINRGDALRYIVLYEFGGIYADLDVESIRPLDRATKKYACIFPSEPLVQGILRLNLPYLINNAIMMCRPKHPFLMQMIKALHFSRPMADQIDTAGPCFVTSQFLIYNNITGDQYLQEKRYHTDNSPYFYTGELPVTHQNAVYVPNTRYFLDTLDNHPPKAQDYMEMCTKDFEYMSLLKKRACAELERRGFVRRQSEYVFTKHHWWQLYTKQELSVFDRVFKYLFVKEMVRLENAMPNYEMY